MNIYAMASARATQLEPQCHQESLEIAKIDCTTTRDDSLKYSL